jgi:transposase
LFLFAADLVARNEDMGVAGSDEPPGKAKKARGHGRQRLPGHLERRQVEYDLEADQRRCPECHQELKPIGEEVTERLEYVPASLHVIREVCYKYACPRGCTAITASKPMQAIEKGLPGPGLLAHVAVSKYADHCVPRMRTSRKERRSAA